MNDIKIKTKAETHAERVKNETTKRQHAVGLLKILSQEYREDYLRIARRLEKIKQLP